MQQAKGTCGREESRISGTALRFLVNLQHWLAHKEWERLAVRGDPMLHMSILLIRAHQSYGIVGLFEGWLLRCLGDLKQNFLTGLGYEKM